MSALQTYLLGNDLPSLTDQVVRPCGSEADACWEYGRPDGHVAVGCLFGKKEGDAQSGVLHDITLQGIACFGCQLGREPVGKRLLRPWVGTVDRPQHSDVLFVDELAEVIRLADVFPLGVDGIRLPAERTEQLSYFLVERHTAHQVGKPYIDGQRRVLIVGFVGCPQVHGGGNSHCNR